MKKHLQLLALPLCMLLLLSLLAGCGAASMGSAADTAAGNTASAEAASPESPSEAAGESPELATGTQSNGAVPPAAALSEKIIYSADLTIETTAFDQAVTAVERLAADCGGFVEASRVSGNASYQNDGTARIVDRYAEYTLRVPSSCFQQALHQTGAIGNVIQSSSRAENVTSQFVDQEARQNSLKVQEQRLLDLLEQSADVETLVELESRLSDVRYEIESIERTLRNLQTQVDYSTIQLSLYEVAVYTPTASVQRSFGSRLADALRTGWNGFVAALQSLAVGLVYCLPVLLILGAAAFAIVHLVRRRRAKRQPPRQDASSEEEPERRS